MEREEGRVKRTAACSPHGSSGRAAGASRSFCLYLPALPFPVRPVSLPLFLPGQPKLPDIVIKVSLQLSQPQ